MKVVLLRHGAPQIDTPRWQSAAAFRDWLKCYERAVVTELPPPDVSELAAVCDHALCSDLPRSLTSAEGLAVSASPDSLWRECSLPAPPLALPPLPTNLWLLGLRLAWLAGYRAGGESFAQARLRAGRGADRLVELTREHGIVVLVGHGLFNRLLLRELRRRGWALVGRSGGAYWSTQELVAR